MPLFSEHISNMYYSGAPSYSSPSYGYKSPYTPLGSSYSASYLSPGGSYGNHSSISSYSRAPLPSRWIPGMSRTYSPMLTPISERSTSSPLRINSPRRIPISKRSYGTPSYIQRPININTESIDVSRDRYRPKPEEPAPVITPYSPPQQKEDPVMENGPFMPRVDGKPETGIDSSPGIQRSTIKRGRTVVRLHTIKRKDKDSPRRPLDSSLSQDSDVNKQDFPEPSVDVDEPKESLRWREKLSDDLVYVDKKERKSLGTKLVEKFIVKDVAEKDSYVNKSNEKTSELSSEIVFGSLSPNCEMPSTSRSPDRRCSVEMLAEQANLLDSLIRGENLSTTTLDLSKVGIVDESQIKFNSSESIKRRKTDSKGNPLKTTKSDHSLHDNINKSFKANKDSKSLTKRRSLKKSHSGGSICRLDSITEFPKEHAQQVDLPSIQENKCSPKEQKVEQTPKIRTKITSSVEISPAPSSPLKFRIDNVIVEEKHLTPKKEISFSYDVDETPIQDVTLQSPKTTLKRTKERNSIKKKSKKIIGSAPVSPEPDDGNFWAKIGKRETVYLIKRKQHIEAAKEENQRSLGWFPEEEVGNASQNLLANRHSEKSDVSSNMDISSDPILKVKPNNTHAKKIEAKVDESQGSKLVGKSKSSDNMHSVSNVEILSEREISKVNYIKDNEGFTNKSASTEEISNIMKTNDSFSESLKTAENQINAKTETPKPVESSGIKSIESNISIITDETNENATHDNKINGPVETSKTSSLIIPTLAKIENQSHEMDSRNNTEKAKTIESTEINVKVSAKADIQAESSENIVQPQLKIRPESKGLDTDSKSSKAPSEIIQIDKSVLETKPSEVATPVNKSVSKMLLTENQDTNAGQIMEKEALSDISGMKESDVSKVNTHLSCTIEPVIKIKPILQNLAHGISDLKSNKKETIQKSKSSIDLNLSSQMKTISNVATPNRQTQAKSKSFENDSNPSEPNEDSKLCKNLVEKPMTVQNTKVFSVSTLKEQATNKAGDKTSQAVKNKTMETVTDPKTVMNKSITIDKSKKGMPSETTESNSKKKVNKVVKVQQKDLQKEKQNSPQKDKICGTCKKSLDSDKSKEIKTKVISFNEPTVSNQVTDKVVTMNECADKLNCDVQEDKLSLDSVVAVPTSQIQVVIESTNIPHEVVTSNTENVQTSTPSQDKTGEENKAENIKEDIDQSIKEVKPISHTKPIKEEKALKPLIATPRPLLKKTPQVIHSESSDTSSEESSEEEEESESEDSGEFYECDNNPDGRTSTGSNDSGFDSSAPTSPASFLQIKKGGGDSPGPSSSNTSAQMPDAEVVDSELELEQSTVYGVFRKTGRITPPARSIPRFRKYNIEDFQFIKVLGKGSFGKVLLAELSHTEYYYAVKCLKKDVVLEDDDVECTLIERKVLALGTNHPYLCHLFATFQTDSHLFFVMEYLNGGDLMFHIQQSGRFPEPRARFYAAEIVSGLKFLHKRGIVYRDLKLDNILLDFDGHVRIADFGMCKLQIYLDKTADTFCGTPDYMAPEIIKGLKYNQTVDWWSFGVLLYEMLIGQSPFSGCDEDELFWSICNEMPSYPRFLSREALTILTRLLDKDAKTRLGGAECMHGDIREQEFFYHVHWDKLERRELETPFKPRVRHPLDTQYFDRAFTGERPRLTAVEPHVLRSMDQEPFRGFSYTNPNATDR